MYDVTARNNNKIEKKIPICSPKNFKTMHTKHKHNHRHRHRRNYHYHYHYRFHHHQHRHQLYSKHITSHNITSTF
uniref:Uncharacterized protein n=1 Tax=Glossina austeni TaxID=7395 RepID=A0A1A9VUR7_GLOAU